MSNFFVKLNDWLSKNMSIGVFSGLILGFFVHVSASFWLKTTVIALFAYMTFVTALSTSLKQFFHVLCKPWIPLWVLFLVHCVTPVAVWAAGIFFFPDDAYIRLGYLIGASIPIGVTSVIWTALDNGNLAIALAAVTLDTFIVPLVLPVFFHIVVGQTFTINYIQMVEELMLMVTVPSIIGMYLHDRTSGRIAAFSNSIGGATAKLSLFAVIMLNSAVVIPQINWDVSMLKALLVTLPIVAGGYFVGYLGSFALKDRPREVVLTMIYNVGIRNNSCGLVLALAYFPPVVAVPITLSILFQQPLATLISNFYNSPQPRGQA